VGLGFSYAKLAFKAADYDKLQAENIDLKIQKKNLEVATAKLGSKLTTLETRSEKLQNLIENDTVTQRSNVTIPAVGGSTVDYPTADLIRTAGLRAGVEVLRDRTADLETRISLLEQIAQKNETVRRFTPTIWPVRGTITSHYGNRRDPFNGESEMHLGLDISALYGAQVRAPAAGVVVYSQRKAAYGNLAIIDHGNGITTRHGHLSRLNVKVNQRVQRNDVIGLVGTTGRSTAPHLHYEVRVNDRPRNPRNYLPRG
jgi:murein DD-endopeptidase MepM/ murein hydrolase activator NlpD